MNGPQLTFFLTACVLSGAWLGLAVVNGSLFGAIVGIVAAAFTAHFWMDASMPKHARSHE